MPSRVAVQLRKENNVQVEVVRGGLGEFSDYVDDRNVMTRIAFGIQPQIKS
jgi:hypothetical protein